MPSHLCFKKLTSVNKDNKARAPQASWPETGLMLFSCCSWQQRSAEDLNVLKTGYPQSPRLWHHFFSLRYITTAILGYTPWYRMVNPNWVQRDRNYWVQYQLQKSTKYIEAGLWPKIQGPHTWSMSEWKNAGRSSKICRWVSGKVVPRLGYTWGQHLRRGHSDGSQGEVLTWGFP